METYKAYFVAEKQNFLESILGQFFQAVPLIAAFGYDVEADLAADHIGQIVVLELGLQGFNELFSNPVLL